MIFIFYKKLFNISNDKEGYTYYPIKMKIRQKLHI